MDRQLRSLVEKRAVTIEEVDMTQHRVMVRDQWKTPIQISMHFNDGLVAIPAVGELWTIARSGSQWYLDKQTEDGSEVTPLTDLQPGDNRIETSGDLYVNAASQHFTGPMTTEAIAATDVTATSVATQGRVTVGSGLVLPSYSTTLRDALTSPNRPAEMMIVNSTTNRVEFNAGSAATPNWQPTYGPNGISDVDVSATAALAISKLAGFPNVAAQFLAGDGTWGVGLRRLFDSTLLADAAQIDTGATIAQTHAHLLFVFSHRSTRAANIVDALRLNFNADGTAIYHDLAEAISGTNVVSKWDGSISESYISMGGTPAASSPANMFGATFGIIFDYRNTVTHKVLAGVNFTQEDDTAIGNYFNMFVGGRWASTAAISQIAVQSITGGANLKAGTRLSIYGLG